MDNKIILINAEGMKKMITRLSYEVIESSSDFKNIALVGIKTRGEFLANRIQSTIKNLQSIDIPLGTIDITFHRDDFSDKFIIPKLGPSTIPFDINKKEIILIDDVLYTGRTIRAAIDEIFSFGRPKNIKLAVLIDRGHRELPIRPDFVGKNFPTQSKEHIVVNMIEIDDCDAIFKVMK